MKSVLLMGTIVAFLLTTLALGSGTAGSNGTTRVQVFFVRGDLGRCDKVYPVSRRVRRPTVLKGAVEALLRGPTAAERRRGYGGWFSARTAGMLRSIRLSQDVAYIDFRDFRDPGRIELLWQRITPSPAQSHCYSVPDRSPRDLFVQRQPKSVLRVAPAVAAGPLFCTRPGPWGEAGA
jgi:hypothetical protein